MPAKILLNFLLFITLLLHVIATTSAANLEVIAAWKNLAFSFDSTAQEQWAKSNGFYDAVGQKRPYGVDVYVDANEQLRKFVSMPRVSPGIPYTLAEVINGAENEKGPLLRAYPSTDLHLNSTCDGIASIFRFTIQAHCHLLWAIDSGRDFTRAKTQYCPPKVLVFDLLTNELKHSYVIPPSQYIDEVSIFNGITLLPSHSCNNAFAYVTDARGPGLVVVEKRGNRFDSWRITSDFFKADPTYFNVTIANESFRFIDGLYTAAPSIYNQLLYFHPFASLTEYVAPLYLINSKIIWQIGGAAAAKIFKAIGQRPTQSSIEVVNSQRFLFFTLMDPLAIFCWNPKQRYEYSNFKIVVENAEALQFVADLKIRNLPGLGECLVGVSNRLQKHNAGTVNPNEINYRIFIVPIGNIKC